MRSFCGRTLIWVTAAVRGSLRPKRSAGNGLRRMRGSKSIRYSAPARVGNLHLRDLDQLIAAPHPLRCRGREPGADKCRSTVKPCAIIIASVYPLCPASASMARARRCSMLRRFAIRLSTCSGRRAAERVAGQWRRRAGPSWRLSRQDRASGDRRRNGDSGTVQCCAESASPSDRHSG
jgi:hypothetical protein